MSGSIIVATKAAIVSTLSARPALSGVQVTYSDEPELARRERLYLGDVDEGDHDPAALRSGRRLREENFTLHLYAEVVGKPNAAANELRTLELVREAEEALADDPKLGGVPGLSFATVEGLTLRTSMTTEGPLTRADLRIRVKGRLL